MKRAISLVLVCTLLVSTLIPAALAESTAPPAQLQIVAPEDGCVVGVGEILEIMVVAQEGLDISAISLMCDGKGIGMMQSAPAQYSWDTKGMETGQHMLRAVAYLRSGGTVAAEPVTLTFVAGDAVPADKQAPAAASPAVVEEGTPVYVETMEKLSSEETQNGTTVRYRVVRDVTGQDGRVLIPYGATAYGRVTEAEHAKAFGKPGKLNFTIESVEAADGTSVPLRASQNAKGKDLSGAVIVGFLFLTILAGFVKGKEVIIPPNTLITAYVDHDTVIGKPLAPRAEGLKSDKIEMVRIIAPEEGGRFRAGEVVTIACQAFPEGEVKSVAVLIDGEVYAERQTTEEVLWDTRGLAAGQYVIEVEVTFVSGAKMKSPGVAITLW